jgi:transposase
MLVFLNCSMDMGYDNNRVYAECDERGCAAIVPLRKNQGERSVRIPRDSDK